MYRRKVRHVLPNEYCRRKCCILFCSAIQRARERKEAALAQSKSASDTAGAGGAAANGTDEDEKTAQELKAVRHVILFSPPSSSRIVACADERGREERARERILFVCSCTYISLYRL